MLGLAVIAWQVGKRVVDIDGYRPRIEAELAKYTGLPVTVEALELAWHPMPCLSAYAVSIGAGDFHAVTSRLDVFPRLWPLLRGRVEIARIEFVEPAVTLPASRDSLEAQWRDLAAHVEAARAEPSTQGPTATEPVKFRIDEVLAESATLRFGIDDAHPIVSTVTASGIGGDYVEFGIEAEVPSAGAHAVGTLRMPSEVGADITGELEISGLQPGTFFELPELAHTDWQAHAELSGKLEGDLAVSIEGSIEPLQPQALGGTFVGLARIEPGGATNAELEVNGEGFEIHSTARLFAEQGSRVRVKKLHVEDAALAALLGAVVRDPLELHARDGAALELRDFELSLAGDPRVTSGVLEAHGVDLRWRESEVAHDLRLEASAADGGIRIAALRGGPIDLHGMITPNRESTSVAVELAGQLALDDALLRALGAPEAIKQVKAVLAIEELSVTLPGPAQDNPPFTVRAHVADGVLQIESDAIAESVSDLDLQLSGDKSALRFEGSAFGTALGAISASAQIEPAVGNARGKVTLADASADFLRDAGDRARVTPALRAYSGEPFAFELVRDAEPPHVRRIRVERVASPRVTAALVLRSDPPEDPLRDLDIAAELPVDALRGFLPEAASASGNGSLRVRRSEGGIGWFAEGDLVDVVAADGDYLEKKAGEALRVRVEGTAGEHWNADKLIFTSEKGTLPLEIGEHGISASALDVDLAAFAFLLVDGGRASGRLRGTFDSHAKSAHLRLEQVALYLTPELGVDEADGTIAIAGDDWGLSDLRLRVGQSAATIDAAVQSAKLKGKVAGERLDLAFAEEVIDQWQALDFPETEPDTSPPITGDLSVAVDVVEYKRAEAQKASAMVRVERDDILVRELAFAVGEGRVTGRVDVRMRDPEPDLLDLELDFANVSRSFLDGLLGEESRGKPGTFTGKLRFAAPLHGEKRAMMADASGSFSAQGVDGTLIGRLGLTTKIITVLRSTEALRMRMPAFQDEGIVFDTVRGDFVMEEGRVEIRTLELDSTSYAMSATGEVNFREDSSRIPIEVNAIRGITSMIERVPVAGDALKIANVRLVVTGSPWDMQVRVASISDQLIGAGLAGPRAVIKRARDALDLMRGGRGAANVAPAPAPESAPEPVPVLVPETPAPAPEPPPPSG